MKLHSGTILRLRDALLKSGRRPTALVSSAFETLAREGLLSPEEAFAVSRVEPLAEVMYLMMAADGKLTANERDAVRGAIRGMADGQIRSATINVMLENFGARLSAQGRDERLHELALELAEERADAEGAFLLAAAIALADDEVAEEENAFINQLAEWFGIDTARAHTLLDHLEADRQTPLA